MSTIIDTIAFLCALLNMVILIDWLRLGSWSTVKPWVMVMIVGAAIWQGTILFYAFRPSVNVWLGTAAGCFVLSLGLVMTHRYWAKGIPEAAKSRPAPLGGPEWDTQP